MSDNDYIKAAVELADGFAVVGLAGLFVDMNVEDAQFPYHIKSPVEALPQRVLDALAAQLVLQVDALDDGSPRVFTHRDASTVTHIIDGYPHELGGTIGLRDRTMNTIRAIVDSGVLAATEQDTDEDRQT